MSSLINEGDIVRVEFNGSQFTLTTRAKVKSVPCQPGDSWIFEDLVGKCEQCMGQGVVPDGATHGIRAVNDCPMCGGGRMDRKLGTIYHVSEGCTVALIERHDSSDEPF